MTEQSGTGETRRAFLRGARTFAGAAVVGLGGLGTSAQAAGPGQSLSEGPWWPSRWGAGDEAGASNWITPTKVLEASRLIKEGRIFRLGHDYDETMPHYLQRSFHLRIPGAPTAGTFGTNHVVANEDFVSGDLGQIGTTMDALGHIGMREGNAPDSPIRYYNGFTGDEVAGSDGLKKLGVEKLKPIFTCGHLVDVARLRGRRLEPGEEISLADVRECLSKQGVSEAEIRQGDAILFRTGHGQLWAQDPSRYYGDSVPGIGVEVAHWVIEKGLCLTGGDTQSVEVLPSKVPGAAFPLHSELQTRNGILNAEDLALEELANAQRYQFAYIFSPVPFKGATGSPGCPIAVV